MSAVWKYPLAVTDVQEVEMPAGAEILSAQVQDETLCLWALVVPGWEEEPRRIRIVGTGNPFDHETGVKFIGTVQMHSGLLVWHVFEELV